MFPSPPPQFLRGALALAVLATMPLSQPASCQEAAPQGEASGRTLHVSPPSLDLRVGESAPLEVLVQNAQGEREEVDVVFFSRSRGAVKVTKEGVVHAIRPGDFRMVVRTARGTGERVSVEIPVTVAFAEIAEIELLELPTRLFAGTARPLEVRIIDEIGTVRTDMSPSMKSSDPNVASVDDFGHLMAKSPGVAVIEASAGNVSASLEIYVEENPAATVELVLDATHVRTGDVVNIDVIARDGAGESVQNAPIDLSFTVRPDDELGQGASGQIAADGRFVAEAPGYYTIVASCGTVSGRTTIRADAREVQRKIKLLGQGKVGDVHTSDLWVWEGVDGRDYAVTGTWGANGDAIFWDVTDPTAIEEISRHTVDARTVNDVKVSEDGTLCVLSREGASNRKNGIVLIDVTNPREPKEISTYTEDLTGGVHNLFIYDDHVFALSAGRRYDIIDIKDRTNPHRVGSFELDTPGHSIHDVWVVDGIAYSSNWGDGVYIVDVGNGVAGGTVHNPVVIGHYAYPSGWNHAAFPYLDTETGKFYVVAGDEAFPYGLSIKDKPTYPRGWLHFIDFTDPENPQEVARYEVPEAGTHNLWIEDDVLYVGYYNGGVRAVDISGDLMGDLYKQGREIGTFLSADHEGVVPNAPMAWGPQPHKGRVFFSDWNSGLWAVELEPATE